MLAIFLFCRRSVAVALVAVSAAAFGLICPLPPGRAAAQGDATECDDIKAILRLMASGFQQIRGSRTPDGRWAAARNVANYRSCSIVPLTQETFICEAGAIPSASIQTFIGAKAAMLKSRLGSEWQQLPSIGGAVRRRQCRPDRSPVDLSAPAAGQPNFPMMAAAETAESAAPRRQTAGAFWTILLPIVRTR
jgi:hypothetical protein